MKREQSSGSQSDRVTVKGIKNKFLNEEQNIKEYKEERNESAKQRSSSLDFMKKILEIKDQKNKINQKEEYPKEPLENR